MDEYAKVSDFDATDCGAFSQSVFFQLKLVSFNHDNDLSLFFYKVALVAILIPEPKGLKMRKY